MTIFHMISVLVQNWHTSFWTSVLVIIKIVICKIARVNGLANKFEKFY